MEQTSVQKLARVLRVLVIIIFACNLLALPYIPLLAGLEWGSSGEFTVGWGLEMLAAILRDPEMRPAIFAGVWYFWIFSWDTVFREAPIAVLTLFFGTCGICTAVILWQCKRVLDTILTGKPFSMENTVNLKQAAVCCFIISGASLGQLILALVWNWTIWSLLTTNTLFVLVFLVGGLLLLVMSSLFRQAAELRAENDLTI